MLLVGAVVFLAPSGLLPIARATAAGDPLTEEKSGGAAVIDWRRGAIAATGGAAADHRMPSADAARPGAERRARAAARARLAEVLRTLPLGGGRHLDEAAVTRAVEHAHLVSIDYQSNGGALVRMEVAFGAWTDSAAESPVTAGATVTGAAGAGAPPFTPDASAPASLAVAPLALSLSEARLAAAPLVVVGGQEVAVSSARYVVGGEVPTGVKPLAARSDKKGRLLVGTAEKAQKAERTAGTASRRGDVAGARTVAEFAGLPVVVYVHKILR